MKEKELKKLVHKKAALKKKTPKMDELKMLHEFAMIESKINLKNFKVKASACVSRDGFEGLYKNANFEFLKDEDYPVNVNPLN